MICVRKGLLTIILAVTVVAVLGHSDSHSHEVKGHSHSHGEGHSHSHGEDPAFKYSQKANDQYKKDKVDELDQNLYLSALASTVFISIVPFLVLFVIPVDGSAERQPLLKILLSFASGGLLGDAFLHLIPHALMSRGSDGGHSHSHDGGNHHFHDTTVGLGVLGGIILFLIVEKAVRLFSGGHGHGHEKNGRRNKDKKDIKIAGYLNLAADFLHNFTDGLAIGASFIAGQNIGYITTVIILLHEIPHEIGDYAILLQSGCSRKKAMFLQLLTAFGAISGTVLSIYVQDVTEGLVATLILPFTAGGFIYIATVSVIPELLEGPNKLSQSIKEILALLAGVYMMLLIAQYE